MSEFVTVQCLNCESHFILSEDMLKCPVCQLQKAQERIDKLESALIDLRREAGYALNPPPPQD